MGLTGRSMKEPAVLRASSRTRVDSPTKMIHSLPFSATDNSADTSTKRAQLAAPQALLNDNEPYPTYTLEEVLAQAAERFHILVKNGYTGNIMGKEIKLPPLDPLHPGTLSKKV